MSLPWTYLIIAGILEWGWPVGLKLGVTDNGYNWKWLSFAGVTMILSGGLLMIAQQSIPMGTAYAVWTGIGAIGAFALGILLFKESKEILRFVFVAVILAGIIGLKMSSH